VKQLAARIVAGLLVFALLGWGVGALWTSLVGSHELSLVRDLAEARSSATTSAMRVVTWAGSLWALVPLALVCCVLLVRGGYVHEALALALGLLGGALIPAFVKPLVDRARPPVEHLQMVGGPSFPSGHATQASAFWLSLLLVLGRLSLPGAVLALAYGAGGLLIVTVCFSRVYLGVHYPSDVIAGLLLGGGWALYARRCVERLRYG
jgi:undecaprenyl-diphosphatase